MANRSYLYSLSNRPAAYADRPETISSLSEWAYDVPFVYRLLLSADPQLCASLVAEGLDGDEDEEEEEGEDATQGVENATQADAGAADQRVRLHAISSPFAPGLARVRRLAEIIKVMIATPPVTPPAVPPAAPSDSLFGRLRRLFSAAPATRAVPAAPVAPATTHETVEHLPGWLDEAVAFLEAHRDAFLLLETVELDMMSAGDEAGLRRCVEEEIDRCRAVGAAFEALPTDLHEAARWLRRLAVEEGAAPLDAFHGLRFDDKCDDVRSGTERPLGLGNWSEVLYFALSNRAQFEARRARG
jgi:hypothetical protein